MATEGETRTDSGAWFGAGSEVSRLRGRAFELTCLGASLFGLAVVGVLLTKVALDATRPTTAEPGWLATFLLTLVVPTVALLGYFARRDPAAGWVGAPLVGLPAFGTLLGAGLGLLFIQILSPLEWFAIAVGLAVTAALAYAHRRLRPAASSVERTAVVALLVWLTVVGIPPIGLGFEMLSLADMILVYSPLLPIDLTVVMTTVALPVAVAVSYVIDRRREGERDRLVAGGLTLALAVLAAAAGPVVGLAPYLAIVLSLSVVVPTALYAEAVVRRGEHTASLWLPATVFGGALLGAVVVRALGFAGPNAWLDWQFLTDLPSRFPEQAGIYPAIVGSIMIMIVIVVAIFPIGVAAALYLEEYAPSQGFMGRMVTLIEINIGNLAGVPSVVYGLLALAVFVNTLGMDTGIVVVGGMAVGLLILPIVIISAQEAIRAVPDSMRQASYGMGATKWQTVRNVVLPEALPGILTGSILAFGRAIGETAPLLMIGVAGVIFQAPGGFFDKTSAMPRQIYSWASYPQAEFRYGVLAAGVVALLVVLLSMNAAAILIRNKYQRRT